MFDLRTALTAEHSKSKALLIVDWIGDDVERHRQLMDLFFSAEYQIHQRSAWVVILSYQEQPHLIQPYLVKLVDNLDNPVHDAVIRNTIRIFEEVNIPEEIEGKLYDKCIKYLTSPKYAVAIRAFSMTVASRIAIKYPELKEELIEVIELFDKHEQKPGFHSRAKKTLKILRKKNN